mgnify:CR=1 FL=1
MKAYLASHRRTPYPRWALAHQIASRHRLVAKMSDPFIMAKIANQKLTAPDMAVITVTNAIKNNADSRLFNAMLSQAAGEMSMVMLNGNRLQTTLFQGITCRIIIRVQIMGDLFRLHFEDRLQMRNRLFERFVNVQVLQIADVLTQKSPVTTGQAEGVLQLCADSKDRWSLTGQSDTAWHKAA